ncbi:MAG: TRAP transporter fused permease subunit, partial [Deltaproteobacteria bacterium]
MRIEKGTGSFDSNTAAGEVNFQPGGGAPLSKYRELKGGHKAAVVGLCASGVSISIVQIFFILTYFGVSFYEISYYYAFYAAFLPPVFLFCPAFPRSPRNRVPWYDLVLFALTLSCLIYFSAHGYTLFFDSWMFTAPTAPTILGAVLLVLILEATRRSAGNIFFAFCLFFLFFPMLAPYVPAPFVGQGYSFWGTIRLHSMGTDSLLGIPIMVLADLLIGFIIFGVAMTITGGGKFFLDLSLSILGSSRGGPAKVSVLASALFGSLSGSVMSNVLTTGSITIPTMKRIGYPSYYAGAIETCASAGGVLMPPIMGSTAFIMAMFIGVPYLEIAVAAAVPSILYFSSILMQVDAYAAKNTISGLDRSELPSLRRTMKEGWFYVLSFLLLVWIVAHLRLESRAPFIATASLLALTMLRKQTRLRGRSFAEFMEKTARLLAELTTILAGVSLMIGALTMTGVSAAFASEILSIAGKNLYILLLLTAFTSIVLG